MGRLAGGHTVTAWGLLVMLSKLGPGLKHRDGLGALSQGGSAALRLVVKAESIFAILGFYQQEVGL